MEYGDGVYSSSLAPQADQWQRSFVSWRHFPSKYRAMCPSGVFLAWGHPSLASTRSKLGRARVFRLRCGHVVAMSCVSLVPPYFLMSGAEDSQPYWSEAVLLLCGWVAMGIGTRKLSDAGLLYIHLTIPERLWLIPGSGI